MKYKLYYQWRKFWARYNGPRGFGRVASRLAAWGTAPYQGRMPLANFYPRGFVAHSAYMIYPDLTLGRHVLIGDRVTLTAGDREAGPVRIGDHALLFGDTFIQTGSGGSIRIGEHAHLQPGCHLRAFVSSIEIGRHAEIASGCAFYSFDHGMAPGRLIMEQPLTSRGPIVIGDGAWLGHGVTVLAGVTIGAGAVIGAGSVVVRDIPEQAIAVGAPARVLKKREISEVMS